MGKKSQTVDHTTRMGSNARTNNQTRQHAWKNNKNGPKIKRQRQQITLIQIVNAWKQAAKYLKKKTNNIYNTQKIQNQNPQKTNKGRGQKKAETI